MNEELNNLIDDILKEKLKLHYENEELEAQGKLIKELCKEIERLKEQLNDEIDDGLKQSEIMLKQHNEIERLNNIINNGKERIEELKERTKDISWVELEREDYCKELDSIFRGGKE